MKDVQWFIEEYYPGYSSSEDVARIEDLYKLLYNEYNKGDSAYVLLQEQYEGNINNPNIYWNKEMYRLIIIEKAVEGYLQTLKE